MLRVTAFRFRPLDVPLIEPFGIAGGAQEVAKNVLVELELEDGTLGIGEAAPFPAVNGETQTDVLAALETTRDLVLGADARQFRPLDAELAERLTFTPTALAAIEIALFDALARHADLPLWALFGGAESKLQTDITIPTGDETHARDSARRAREGGFSSLKIKIDGRTFDRDVVRVRAIHDEAPDARLLLDANASLSAQDALTFLSALAEARDSIVLFEQPTPAEDYDGLARVQRDGHVLVLADESVRSRADLIRIVRRGDIGAVNVKTAKVGLVAAWDLLVTARTAGLDVMIGGMVETELSMSTSACLAAGVGGVRFVDLDTPLFLGPRPLRGGFEQRGPWLDLSTIRLGHGVSVVS